MAASGSTANRPVTIKKYANRRLYNTASSSYVTLEHLCQMVKDGEDFLVYDAKTGEDITRSVLTQIIVDEENKGPNLLPISFLRQLIGLYGDSMQWMVPSYLEYSMQVFARNQEKMRDYFQTALGGMFPFGGFEEMSKHNLAIFDRAMRMFTPFGPDMMRPPNLFEAGGSNSSSNSGNNSGQYEGPARSLEELKQRIEQLHEQLRASKSETPGETPDSGDKS